MKIFTMVKGEADIVKDWVMYHGNLFGFTNLYIIDNFSRDGTYEILLKLKKIYNINVFKAHNYKNKGVYMTSFYKSFCNNEFAFPIDIDEFIVYYDKNTNNITCDSNLIINYINSIANNSSSGVYKMNYINPKLLNPNGYERAAVESTNASYSDYGITAKSFFKKPLFNGNIDHGNHYVTNNYFLTDICLVHFHCRNMDQMKKKVYNNVLGLGYHPFKINLLKKTIATNGGCSGNHHIRHQINILENKYSLCVESENPNDINLKPLSEKILTLD
jgi:hypothetical protein